MANENILLFDLTNHVHFPMYVRCWLDYWRRVNRAGQLSIFVSQYFVKHHSDIIQLAAAMPQANVQFLTPTADEASYLRTSELTGQDGAISFTQLLQEGRKAQYVGRAIADMFYKASQQVGADISVMCHIEPYLPLLIAGVSAPRKVAGIFAAPIFYYDEIPGNPRPLTTVQRQDALRQKFIIARALKHPNLTRLMFTDEHADIFIRGFPNMEKISFLPEPVIMGPVSPAATEALREQLGVDQRRRVLLLLGGLEPRKGIGVLIEAVKKVPHEICQQICIVLAGFIAGAYRANVDTRLDELVHMYAVQIVRRYGYVPDGEIAAYFHLADVVLTLYQFHNGNSNINMMAAAAQRPILSSSYGNMGYTVREQKLGIAVDTQNVDAVAQALVILLTTPQAAIGDKAQIQAWIDQHNPQRAAQAFFDALDEADRTPI